MYYDAYNVATKDCYMAQSDYQIAQSPAEYWLNVSLSLLLHPSLSFVIML